MPKVIITPLNRLEQVLRDYQPSHLVSLLSPEQVIAAPVDMPGLQHLRLAIPGDEHDITLDEKAMTDLLDFVRLWGAFEPIMLQCSDGISRSMAAAFILMCDRLDHVQEKHIAAAIEMRAPHGRANRLMVQIADDLLGRQGRMNEAMAAMGAKAGASAEADRDMVVQIPLAFGLQ